MSKERIVGRAFVGKTVNLADAEFVDCDFTNCIIVVDGQPVELDGNIFIGGNRWLFDGPARETLKLIRWICRSSKADAMGESLIADLFGDPELAKQFTTLRRQRRLGDETPG